jgi:hypothetical protein
MIGNETRNEGMRTYLVKSAPYDETGFVLCAAPTRPGAFALGCRPRPMLSFRSAEEGLAALLAFILLMLLLMLMLLLVVLLL